MQKNQKIIHVKVLNAAPVCTKSEDGYCYSHKQNLRMATVIIINQKSKDQVDQEHVVTGAKPIFLRSLSKEIV